MRTRIKFTIGLLLLIWSNTTFSQEFLLPIQNQYISDNDFVISSAFAGIGGCIEVRALGITQWAGIDNSPNTQSLSIDGLIASKTALGLVLFNDSNGFTSQQGVRASFAHHLTLDEQSNQYLSFGISYLYTQFGIDANEFNVIDRGLRGDISVSNHNFEVSTLYRFGGFFFNASAYNLINKEITEFDSVEPPSIFNYYVYTGYVFKPKFNEWEIEPSLFYQRFRGDTRATSDVNFKVRKRSGLEDYFWGGISMRFINDQEFTPLYLSPMGGFNIGNIYAGYSYQINLNRIQQFNQGTHMLTIGVDFGCRSSRCGCTKGSSMK